MRKKRPPEQVSVTQASPQAPEKHRQKQPGGPHRASGKGEAEWFRNGCPAEQADAEHGSGDRRQPSRLGPGPGKVVLLRRDSPGSTTTTSNSISAGNNSSTGATTCTKKKSSPKKKVEWIPYTAAPSSPVLSPVWIYKKRGALIQHREPSPPTLDNLSLNEPLLPLDTERPGAGEGSSVLGLRAPRWTESTADQEVRGQELCVPKCLVSEGDREEAEARTESPGGDGSYYYSSAPASSGGMLPFRRKKSSNLWASISWADDDYWASWDGWNEVIDWEDNGPTKRRGRNRNREGKRNSNRWGNKSFH